MVIFKLVLRSQLLPAAATKSLGGLAYVLVSLSSIKYENNSVRLADFFFLMFLQMSIHVILSYKLMEKLAILFLVSALAPFYDEMCDSLRLLFPLMIKQILIAFERKKASV